jgi:6-phosphogluconolactonase
MRMKVRALKGMLTGLLLLVSLGFLASCFKSSSSIGSGTGFLFITTQGDSLVSSFTINLGSGVISANGKGAATGNTPSAIILAPAGSTLFVANRNPSTPPAPGTITSYTVNADGTLSAGSCTAAPPACLTDLTPVGMATDSGGKFLFVANQGSNTISVFSISGTSLTLVASPFPTGNGPSALAITPDAKFLYVANQVDATVTEYSVDQNSGALTPVGVPFPVHTTPSALAIVLFPDTTNPTGEFLYVANTGSNNVSAFTICDQATASCNSSNVNHPDGSLSEVTGSPFPDAGSATGPVSIAAAPSGKFLYVVDTSNQVSEYKISTGTGVLTPNSSATISTGFTPVSLAVRAGTTTVKATGGTSDFAYVANIGSASISAYTFDSTVGTLGVVGAPVSTGGQPSAIAVK